MKNNKKIFYEDAYPGKKENNLPKGLLWLTYSLIKKYEKYREDVAYELLPKGDNFLDIGCGEGNLVFKCLQKYRHVYGVDIAGTRISLARKRRLKLPSTDRKRVHFIAADADSKLPFKEGKFQAVTLIAVLEHLFDPYQVIKETRRVLETKGILIIEVPNIAYIFRRLSLLFGKLPKTSHHPLGWDGGHLHYFTISSLNTLLKENGYIIDKVSCSGVGSQLRSIWPSLLGADIVIKSRKK